LARRPTLARGETARIMTTTNIKTTTKQGKIDMAQHQFAICDVETKDTGTDRYWDGSLKATVRDVYGLADGVVNVFGPRGGGEVPVEIVIAATQPALELDAWSQVFEASIHIEGTKLVVDSEEPEDAWSVPVTPGTYRARVMAARLETVEYDGNEGDEAYRIELWPDASGGAAKVLKKYSQPEID
jgi:hypothetical protein